MVRTGPGSRRSARAPWGAPSAPAPAASAAPAGPGSGDAASASDRRSPASGSAYAARRGNGTRTAGVCWGEGLGPCRSGTGGTDSADRGHAHTPGPACFRASGTLYRVRLAGTFPPRDLRYVVFAGSTPVGYGIPVPGEDAVRTITGRRAVLTATIAARPESKAPFG